MWGRESALTAMISAARAGSVRRTGRIAKFYVSVLHAAARGKGGVPRLCVVIVRDSFSKESCRNKPARDGSEMAPRGGRVLPIRCDRGRGHSKSARRRAPNVLCGGAEEGRLLKHRR